MMRIATVCALAGAVAAQGCDQQALYTEIFTLSTDNTIPIRDMCTRLNLVALCIQGMAETNPQRGFYQTQLDLIIAPLDGACGEIENLDANNEPTIDTDGDGTIRFTAEEILVKRRTTEDVSLFDMYDRITSFQGELSSQLADNDASLSTQTAVVSQALADIVAPYASLPAAVSSLEADAARPLGPYGPCMPGVEWHDADDDECKYLTTSCQPGQYMARRPTRTSDRVCEDWSECNFDTEWMAAEGTSDTDRDCRTATTEADCNALDKWIIRRATQTSDAECGNVNGLTRDNPATSCTQIKKQAPDLESGEYWMRASNGLTKKVHCEQEWYGGGWMRIGHQQNGNYPDCWHSSGECQESNAPGHGSGSWKYGDSFINGFNYDVLVQDFYDLQDSTRRRNEGGLKMYWKGKAIGGCTLQWQSHTYHGNGQCDCSIMDWNNPGPNTVPTGNRCCGHHHGCHYGMGDWPCHRGEATLNHCRHPRGPYLYGYRKDSWDNGGQEGRQTNMDVWMRVKF